MKKKKEKHYYSIRFWLFIMLVMLVLGSVLIVENLIFYSFKKSAIDNRKDKIINQSMVLSNQVVESGVIYTGLSERVAEAVNQMADDYSGRAMIIDSLGRVAYDTANVDKDIFVYDARVIKAMQGKHTTEVSYDNFSILVVMPLTGNNTGNVIGTLIFSASVTDIEVLLSKVHKIIISVDLIMLVVTIVIILFICYYIGKPFRQMKESIQKVSDGEQKTIDQLYYKETREITSAFDKLMADMSQQDENRRQFVSNVSHELKTPITSMRVLADSLLSMPDAPKELYQEFMMDISSEIDREAKIISDLLELVRMDNSAVSLSVAQVNINEWLQDILHRLLPIAKKQNVELVMESFREVAAEIDQTKLSLAISNLVENAIKYNKDKGYVHVSLNADHKFFYIKVEDNGVGIPEDAMDKIFDRFYRVDKARSRDAGGTGLGLAITKSVIQMHRGVIRVYSRVSEGTTFSVRLPLQYKVREQEGKQS